MDRTVSHVDVFTTAALAGNPVAVVHDADGMADAEMLAFTRWLNLSESTFLVAPSDPAADYRVRIFTPRGELPFAGHPTLGTCHAWLEAGGIPTTPGVVLQECGVGLVGVHRDGGRLAFEAPPLTRSGPPTEAELAEALRVLRIDAGQVIDAAWTDNGPGWLSVLLGSVEEVLAVTPDTSPGRQTDLGVIAPQPAGSDTAIEVRAFFTDDQGLLREDPVTGSLNASVAMWLTTAGRQELPYVAAQGTALGRAGRVHVATGPDGVITVGGDCRTVLRGTYAG